MRIWPVRGSWRRCSERVWPIPWMIPPSIWLEAPERIDHAPDVVHRCDAVDPDLAGLDVDRHVGHLDAERQHLHAGGVRAAAALAEDLRALEQPDDLLERCGSPGTPAAPLEEIVGLLGNGQILGRGARPEPHRHEGADVRRAGGRGGGRRRDRRGLGRPDRRGARRRTRDQSARRLEPDRGRDHPGDRPHPLRAPPQRPAHGPHPHDERSTPTRCRRSPTCPRSSASWSTSRTRS